MLLILFINTHGYAQQPDDPINKNNLNIPYLERLTKEGIDKIRQKHKLRNLRNNEFLYKAAILHAQYLVSNKFGHFQPEKPKTKTVQDRVNFFGARDYFAGENLIMIPLGVKIDRKNIYTYQQAADFMIEGWVNSPGHFRNIINNEYTHTGMGMVYDEKNNKLYAVQVFALVLNFDEHEEPEISLVSVRKKKTTHRVHKYPYRLKANDATIQKKYRVELARTGAQLDINKDKIHLLVIDGSRHMQDLIRKRKDGLALEFVTYTQFRCGNPDYYYGRSRRNEKSFLNGELTVPLYRNEIYRKLANYHSADQRGPERFKMGRKLSKSYIKGESTPPFWHIPVGEFKDFSDYHEVNLVYIRKKKLTSVVYFGIGSGIPLNPPQLPQLKADWPQRNLEIKPNVSQLNYEVLFELNESALPVQQARTVLMIDSLKKLDIRRIEIMAFASIEGTNSINDDLQKKRGNWIKNYLSANLDKNIEYSVTGSENWDMFARQIRNTPYHYLFKMPKDSIRGMLSKEQDQQLVNFLNDQRKAVVKIHFEDHSFKGDSLNYAWNQWDSLFNTATKSINLRERRSLIDELETLQQYIYENTIYNQNKAEKALSYVFPRREEWARLINNRNWYISTLDQEHLAGYKEDVVFCGTRKGASDIEKFNYTIRLLKIAQQNHPQVSRNIKEIEKIYNSIDWSEFLFREKNPLRDNLNLFLCLYHLPKLKDRELTGQYYRQIVRNFKIQNATDTLQMAQMHLFMHNVEAAHRLLKNAVDKGHYDKEILKLYLILSYFHYDYPLGVNYLYSLYHLLMKHKPELTTDEWCGLFRGNTRISFQALDHENLRKLYCETCGDIQLLELENNIADTGSGDL